MPSPSHTMPERDLGAADVARIIWRDRWLMMTIVFVFAAGSVAYALLAPQWYRAVVLLKPTESKQGQGLLGQLGSLGGLASLAGLGSLTDNRTQESIAVLRSREFVGSFIADKNLLPELFPRKWDAVNKRWLTDDPIKRPDVRDGIRFFEDKVLTVTEERKTGLVSLMVEWHDPVEAADWANAMADRVNELTRNRALALAEYNVGYLKQELASATVVPLQQSIGRVLESELQKLMLAKADKEYAFRVVDHANVPKWRYWPKRAYVVIGATLVGFVFAAFFLVSRDILRRTQPSSA